MSSSACVYYYAAPMVLMATAGFLWYFRKPTESSNEKESQIPVDKKAEPAYLKELRALPFIELTKERLEELREEYMEHEREDGNKVYIAFCVDKTCFVYWSEDRSIPYLELDAIARKYAVHNNCRSICVDYYEEFKSSVKRSRYVDPITDIVTKQPNDVFATFKTYQTKKQKPVMPSHSNSFRRMGNIEDYNARFAKPNSPINSDTTYSEWVKKQK